MPFGYAAAASAVAGIAGSVLQSNAVGNASDKAISAQQQGLAQSRADLAPWTTAGGAAIPAVQDAAGLNGQPGYDAAMAAFHTSPGYQFQLDQGLRSVDAGAAASGMLRSGAALKAEQTFGTGLADQDFGTYYNRLMDLSKLGESAASGTAGQTAAASTGMAQTDLSQGSAMSSIYGNAASGIGTAANNYANQSLYSTRTNALMGGGAGVEQGTWTV